MGVRNTGTLPSALSRPERTAPAAGVPLTKVSPPTTRPMTAAARRTSRRPEGRRNAGRRRGRAVRHRAPGTYNLQVSSGRTVWALPCPRTICAG